MKQNDMILVIVVVFISIVFSIVVSNFAITPPKNRQEQVEVAGPISGEFPEVDTRVFNKSSINPTQVIRVGQDENVKPFEDDQNQ